MTFIQAEVNIGTSGHVDHGKTTLVHALTGEWTDKHSEEIKRGISIRLGYADTCFYHCGECDEYSSTPKCSKGHEAKFLRKVSFVDCPGHENLMAVMLSGASLINGAILVIAANEPCPQAQTAEHLAALEAVGVQNIIIVQNKVDLVTREDALKNYQQIKAFVKGSVAENAPVIPTAAHSAASLNELIRTIQEKIATPKLDETKPLRMLAARSFDVNKPGTSVDKLVGGVIGGTIIQGKLREGEEVEIRPGLERKGKYEPIITKAVTIEGEKTAEARPGGLVAIGTMLDPALTKADRLVGNVIGKPGTLPPVWEKLRIKPHFIERLVTQTAKNLKTGEPIVITAGTATVIGTVAETGKDKAAILLKKPVCVETGGKVALSRKVGNRWILIGYGTITPEQRV